MARRYVVDARPRSMVRGAARAFRPSTAASRRRARGARCHPRESGLPSLLTLPLYYTTRTVEAWSGIVIRFDISKGY